MTITDVIAIVIVAAALGGAIAYIVRAKKRGVKCIGCPSADCCGKAHCSCGCSDEAESDEKA